MLDDMDRQNAVNCKRVGCRYKTRRYDGCCSDGCFDRVRSLPDRYVASSSTPVAPLVASQVER